MKNLKDNPDAGFSLLEVVVALLMIFFFTTGALEMFVLSSIFKKKAIQYTTAINLIQQDMEKIKSAADQYSFPTVTTVATAGATTVALSSTNGFPTSSPYTDDKVIFSNNSNTYTISNIATPTPTLSISPGLILAIPSPTPSATPTNATYAINSKSCNLTAPTPTPTPTPTPPGNSMANYFQNSLSTTATGIGSTPYTVVDTVGVTTNYYAVTGTPTQVKGQYYWLLRKQEVSTDAPYNVLKLSYVVQPGLTDNPSTTPNTSTASTLAKSYTEVIPYASLQCPSQ